MKNKIYLIIIFCFVIPSFVHASDSNDRMDIINRELDCFSDVSVRPGVNWNDFCVISSAHKEETSRDELVTKSMEQMIEEHRQAADEMLGAAVDAEENRQQPKTVDEVYDQHDQYYESAKSVDDIVSSQDSDIEESFSEKPANKVHQELIGQDTGDDLSFMSRPSYSSFSSLARDTDKNQNTAEIGFEFNRYQYEEPVFDLVTKGNLYGMYVNFTARPAKNDALYENILDMYRAEVRLNYGLVDYQSTPSGTLDDNEDWAFESRLLVGKDLMVSPEARLTPYLGFGYRYLNDDSAGRATSTGAIGYERESRYYYIPMGADLTTKLTDSWLISPNLEYDYFIQGEQNSYLSDVSWAYPDVRNKQRKGFGLRGSVKFIQLSGSVNFVFEPYIRYWYIEDSEEATVAGPIFVVTGLEPENKTLEYGIRIGAMF